MKTKRYITLIFSALLFASGPCFAADAVELEVDPNAKHDPSHNDAEAMVTLYTAQHFKKIAGNKLVPVGAPVSSAVMTKTDTGTSTSPDDKATLFSLSGLIKTDKMDLFSSGIQSLMHPPISLPGVQNTLNAGPSASLNKCLGAPVSSAPYL